MSELSQKSWMDVLLTNRITAKAHELIKDGLSFLDDTPLALPFGYKKPETLAQQVARLVRSYEYDRLREGDELSDDDEDWDRDDDQPFSPYELVFDPVLGKEITPQEFIANQHKYKAAYLKKASMDAAEEDKLLGAIPPAAPVAKRSHKAGVAKGARPDAQHEDESDL